MGVFLFFVKYSRIITVFFTLLQRFSNTLSVYFTISNFLTISLQFDDKWHILAINNL